MFGEEPGPLVKVTDWEMIESFQGATGEPEDRNTFFRDSESPNVGRFSN